MCVCVCVCVFVCVCVCVCVCVRANIYVKDLFTSQKAPKTDVNNKQNRFHVPTGNSIGLYQHCIQRQL